MASRPTPAAALRVVRHDQAARHRHWLGSSHLPRIIEEMGGSISAANRAEGGACFEILLPAAHLADQPQAEAA